MQTLQRQLTIVLTLAMATLIGACSLTGNGGREAPRQYQLALTEAGLPALREPGTMVLLVERPQAAPGFDSRQIAYQTQAHELRYYTQSRWADTPARMLGPALIDILEQSGLFHTVLAPPASVAPDYRLVSDSLQLQQHFNDNGASHTLLRLRVQLIDQRQQRILGSRTIEVTRPAPAPTAQGGVVAANEALREAARQIQQFATAMLADAEARRHTDARPSL